MKDIKQTVLDQVADQVLEMLQQPLKKGGLTQADPNAADVPLPGVVGMTCHISQCHKQNSAFYLNPLTNKFICEECAARISAKGTVCKKIYPPIDVYEDGVILIQDYSRDNLRMYCIDTRYGTEEQDTYLQVHRGPEPNFVLPDLVQLKDYQQCIDDIEHNCILLVHYANGNFKEQVDQLLNVCSAATIGLKLLMNAKLEQYDS